MLHIPVQHVSFLSKIAVNHLNKIIIILASANKKVNVRTRYRTSNIQILAVSIMSNEVGSTSLARTITGSRIKLQLLYKNFFNSINEAQYILPSMSI